VKLALRPIGAAILGVALASSVPGLALPVATVWLRAASSDHALSAETPCSFEEVEGFRQLPSDFLKGIILPSQSRIVCAKNGLILLAGVSENSEAEARGSAIFDQLMAFAKADKTAEGAPSLVTIDGHRAFLNRQESNGVVAQTGTIELSRRSIIVAVAGGGQPGVSLTVKEQGDAINRFYGSIKVGGQ
jgi:hypothetical protein